MAGNAEGGGAAISQINVTPLVDVMLVLLVIFMVTAPILQQGVSVDLPTVQAAPLTGTETQLVVSLDREGRLFLNGALVSAEELREKLRATVAVRPDRQVFLRADQRVAYGEVMGVMAAVRRAGVSRLGMVTEPPG